MMGAEGPAGLQAHPDELTRKSGCHDDEAKETSKEKGRDRFAGALNQGGCPPLLVRRFRKLDRVGSFVSFKPSSQLPLRSACATEPQLARSLLRLR